MQHMVSGANDHLSAYCSCFGLVIESNTTTPGVGIYSNFRDHDVNVSTAVTIPEVSGVRMTNIFTVKLDNIGKICSIVNGRGPGPTPDTGRGVPLRCVKSECVLK